MVSTVDADGGQVKIGGEVWSAVSMDGHRAHAAGHVRHCCRGPRGNRGRDVGAIAIMDPVLIVAIVVVVLVIVVLIRSVKVIPQAQAAVIERLGRFNKASAAGLVWSGAHSSTASAPASTCVSRWSPSRRSR